MEVIFELTPYHFTEDDLTEAINQVTLGNTIPEIVNRIKRIIIESTFVSDETYFYVEHKDIIKINKHSIKFDCYNHLVKVVELDLNDFYKPFLKGGIGHFDILSNTLFFNGESLHGPIKARLLSALEQELIARLW